MYRLAMVGILGISLMILTACQSMTGKTAGQTIDDATVTTSVQAKLTGDKASNFSRIDVDTNRTRRHAEWRGAYCGREIKGGSPRTGRWME